MHRYRKKFVITGCAAVLLLLLWYNRSLLRQSPLQPVHAFESVSEVSMGVGGNTYVIDRGKKRLTVVNQKREAVRVIEGGGIQDAFYYACRVCDDSSGNIYIADIVYGSRGNRIEQERIIRLTGNKRTVVFAADYEESENPPLQYGEILELQTYCDQVYFVKAEQGKLLLYCLDLLGNAQLLSETDCPYALSDASYDVSTGTFAITTRPGELYIRSAADTQWRRIEQEQPQNMPWDIAARNGEVYYTELLQRSIMHFSMDNENARETLYRQQEAVYRLDVSPDGSRITATDYNAFFYLHARYNKGSVSEYCTVVKNRNYPKTVALWGAGLLASAALASAAVRACIRLLRQNRDRNNAFRIMLVVGAAVSVSLTVSYSALTQTMAGQSDMLIQNMSLFAEILREEIDTKELEAVNGSEDYHSDAYMRVKAPLDRLIDESYNKEIYYYYLIYDAEGDYIRCLMDYEDTTPCGYPIYVYGDNDYTRALTQNTEIVVADDTSSYGAWVFTLLPVTDSEGRVIAELEVGTSLDRITAEKREILFELVCTIFNSAAVVVMLLLEVLFLISFLERRAKIPRQRRGITDQIPLRSIVFLAYMTDSMQDAFIVLLCDRLYNGGLPVSREVAAALPMSLQLLLAAVFSPIGGSLAEKIGVKKVMCAGFIAQISGFVICLASSGYMGLLIGKAWIGIGMGMIYVTANTAASMGAGSQTQTAFADVAAGVLSGVTIGVGIGSLLLSAGSYKLVYLTGAGILALGLVMALFAKNVVPQKEKRRRCAADTVRFLFHRKIMGFFLLLLIPFMIALSYREYFFPLYMERFGIDEIQIGRIYLACGLAALYAGPCLSGRLLRRLGAKRSVMLASFGMAANMGIFVLFPNAASVTAGLIVLSFIISFAYTCQYTYFEQLPECRAFGEGSAMGIYSMFESLGQTLGPVVYGLALMRGQRMGIALLSAAMALMLVLFALTAMGKKTEKRRRRKEECM